MQYLMKTKTDCGPAAISAITDKPYTEVCQAMKWANHGDGRDNLLDTPMNHFAALAKLGVPHRIVTCGQILAGECKNNKTVILIHAQGFPGSWLSQHWVVLESVTPVRIAVHNGIGGIWGFTPAEFASAYSRGGPTATAYEVGMDGKKPSGLIARFGSFLSSLFGKLFGK